ARYAAPLFPEHCGVCQCILAIPFKRATRRTVEYLEHDEMQALLAAPDRSTAAGCRDHALLLAMYNTGARVQEILDLRPCDLQLDRPRQALLRGKGGKRRCCPLWKETAAVLLELLRSSGVDPADRQPLFRNRSGHPLTRFGVRYILRKHARTAADSVLTLRAKRVHPHQIRHTAASHFLHAGVDMVTISRWMGHASLATTSIYAEVDLESKRKAVQAAKPLLNPDPGCAQWRTQADTLRWLESL
ncbi:MAG: tyrosine-type recombinase/integrase, partial [Bryobacterales bacterium]|nr:tyrosine-type recombinase/integrase [Bryobacterales bacterium]